MKRIYLYAADVFLILVTVFFLTFTAYTQKNALLASSYEKYDSSVTTFAQVVQKYLDASQNVCDNWANLVNSRQMDEEYALKMIKRMYSKDIDLQFIDPLTMKGYSFFTDSEGNFIPVDYSEYYAYSEKVLFRDLYSDSKLKITPAFTNERTGASSIAFYNPIKVLVTDKNGKTEYKDRILVRIEKISAFKEDWAFPKSFEDSEIALVDKDGNYIYKQAGYKSENFTEYIRSTNNLSYEEAKNCFTKMQDEGSGHIFLKNSAQKKVFYSYKTLDSSNRWMIISCHEQSKFNYRSSDTILLVIVIAAFTLLLIINGTSMKVLNSRLKDAAITAEKASKSKTEFLSSMSHDIRTPMNAITGMTEIALRSVQDRETVENCLK